MNVYSALDIVAGSDGRAVDFEKLKRHLRLSSGSDDDLVDDYLATAVEWVEDYLNASLLTKTYRFTLYSESVDVVRFGRALPYTFVESTITSHVFELPKAPVREIKSVVLTSRDGTETPITDYKINYAIKPARIAIPDQYVLTSAANCLTVEYVAGYGAVDDVPARIRSAIMQIVTGLQEHRGDYEPANNPTFLRLLSQLSFRTFS